MKNFYKKFNSLLILALVLIGFGQVGLGQTTVSYDFSASGAVSGLNEAAPGITLDANIGFGSFKNSGTANPTINSGQLRLYQNATKGGSIKIYASNGVTITDLVVNASSKVGSAQYSVDGGASVNVTASSGVYTMSGLSATNNVEFWVHDGSVRIYVDDFDVTYTSPSTGTSTVTAAANGEPSTISSLTTALTGAVSPQLNAVENFNFTYTDDGGTPSTDNIATDITDIVIKQGTGNDITDWTEAIAGAQLSDGSNTATATVNATNLTFSSIGALGDIADDASKTYTLKIWLKTSLGGTLPTTIDGKNFEFAVDNSSFTLGSSSSGLASSQSVSSGGTNNEVTVTATELNFVQQPTNTDKDATMSPAVTVEATDANNNRDLDEGATVSLTSGGTMNPVPDITLSSGFGTFGNIVHTASGTDLTLTASASGLTNAISSYFNIFEPLFCDDFEDDFSDWTLTNVTSGADLKISSNAPGSTSNHGANNTDHLALEDCPNPSSTTNYTSTLEKTFYNVKNLRVDFWYYFEDYRGGEINIYLNGTKRYSVTYNGGNGDIEVGSGDDDAWHETSVDLSSWTSSGGDYTIKIEAVSKAASSWKDRVAFDELCVIGNSACSRPTQQANNGSASNVGSDRMDVNWTRGDGDSVIVIAREGSAVSFTPTDLTTYIANSSFGSGTDLGTGQYCVYNGPGNSVTVTNLAGNTHYYFAVYEYGCNAGSELYLTSSPATADATTLAPAPEINVKQASTDYSSGSTFDFGTVAIGDNSQVTFTIENTGNADLTFSALTISGSSDYAVTTQPTSPIAGGGTDNFVITFTPTSTGTITGSVTIPNNNDSDENPYVINFTAVGSPSNNSDIILNSSFDEPDNIQYANYQSTDIINDGNDIEVAQFTIRDGGSSNDADGFATELTDITFSVSNSSFLRRIAIYDGSSEIAEVDAASSITFSGISLTAPDNSEKTFSLRASFSTTVTDKQQFQFTVTSATANQAKSTFADADAGGASSSIAGDDNRIDVVATSLIFDTQPSETAINATMSPPVTVLIVDDNVNTDVDYTENVSITSTGTMTGDPISVTPSSGTATFSNIVHTVAGTNFTLTASANGLTGDVSQQFDITEFTYQAGDYRSAADNVDLSWNNSSGSTNNWEYFDGSNWGHTPDDKAPQNASTTPTRVIIKNVGVTGGGNTSHSYNDIIVLDGGELILQDQADNPSAKFILSGKKLEVQYGGTLEIQGNFDNDGDLIVRSGGKMIINSPTMLNDDEMWNGAENFEAGSTVQIDDWDWTGTAQYRSLVNIDADISYNNEGYKFGNFILNKTTTENANFTIIGGDVGVINLCYNNFTINNSGTDLVGGVSNKTSHNGFVVNGNFIVNSGDFAFSTSYSTDDFDHRVTINGNFEYNGSGTLKLHSNENGRTPNSISGYVNFKGNVYVAPTATIINDADGAGNYMYMNFAGTSDVDIETSLSHTDMYVKSGATANLVYDMDLTGKNSILTIDNGGVWQIMPTINMTAPSGGIVNNAGSSGFVIKSDATGTGSLIQQDAFPATYERYLTGGANVWHEIFSPLSSASLPSGNVYSYDETKPDMWNATTNFGWDGSNFVANNSYIGWTSASSFDTTQGYIYNSSTTQTAILSGGNLEVNDKTFNVTKTDNSAIGQIPTSGNDPNGVSYNGCKNDWDYYDGWTFVGNPYASAIDWSQVPDDSDIENGAYMWSSTADNYVYYLNTGANGYPFSGLSVNDQGNNVQYIPSGQGFFIKSKVTSGSFTIPASARTHTTHNYWKGEKQIIPNLLRLNISTGDFTDETVLLSIKGATEDFDSDLDLHKRFSIDNNVPQIYSLNYKQNQFALNSFPEFTGHKVVPLGVYIGVAGDYQINITENNFENTHVWLEDKVLGTYTNFLTDSSYEFYQTVENTEDRFYLHFETNTAPYAMIGIPDQTTPVNENFSFTLPNNLFIDNDFEDKITLSVSLANGEELPAWLSFDPKTLTFTGMPTQITTLKIRITATDLFGASNYEDFKLVVYDNASAIPGSEIENMISIYPNPAYDIVNVSIPEILTNTSINIIDESGRTVISKKATSNFNTIDLSQLAPGMYIIEIKDNLSSTKQKLIIK